MARGWGFYFVEIEGRTASIFVDLDPPSPEVEATLAFLVSVRINLHAPGEHGLSTDVEFDALSAIDDQVEALFKERLRARYVGRYTHDGRRTFFAYASNEQPGLGEVQDALNKVGYSAEICVEHDAEWRRYHEWLYPSAEDLQTIEDQNTLEELHKSGDDHSIPRDVDHWIYFSTAADRASVLNDPALQDLQVRKQWDDADTPGRRFGSAPVA